METFYLLSMLNSTMVVTPLAAFLSQRTNREGEISVVDFLPKKFLTKRMALKAVGIPLISLM